MNQMSIFEVKQKLNISDIPFKPSWNCKRANFKDYEVKMKDVIEDPAVKKWMKKVSYEKEDFLNSDTTPFIRVKYDDYGSIVEMSISEYGLGNLGWIGYTNPESWLRLIGLIKKANGVSDNADNNILC